MKITLFVTLFLLATIPAVPGIAAAGVQVSWDPVTMFTNGLPIDPTITVAYDVFWSEDPALATASLHPIALSVPGPSTTFDPDLLGMPRGTTVYITAETVLDTGEASDLSPPYGWMVPPLVYLTPSPYTQTIVGTPVLFTAQAVGGASSYEYKFWIKGQGGVWSVVRDYASANTWTWDTTGLAPGTYQFMLYARSVGSTAVYEGWQTAYHTINPPPVNAVTLTPAPVSPQQPGTSVTFTAQGSGGTGSYEYKFWLRNPAGAWSVVRDYASANTWTWNTTGLPVGTYNVQAWARNTGSTATYEAYTSVASYVLTDPPPPAAAVTFTPPPSPSSPKVAGTSVVWSAAASGGSGS